MQCKDFQQVIEENGPVQLSEAAQAHVAGCSYCTALVQDFSAILAIASEIPAEVEPPGHVWVALRAQLEAEGIIRQPKIVIPAETAPWWQGFGRLIRGRMLATAAVAGLILVAGFYQTRQHPVRSGNPPMQAEPFEETATTLDREEQSLGAMQPASTLGYVSNADTSLRENLVTVNAFIKECQKRLQEDPSDPMAREYLSTAYQQKAEILAAMMERGRSVN
jgi:hypothetical protein